MAAAAEQLTPGWQAALRLGFRPGPGRTVLAERFRQGPLAVQRALYPEGEVCHVYLLHPPGGVAGGDSLDIRAATRAGASALVTTPGATKFYRSNGAPASQRQTLKPEGGTLEWLPQENILFPGAEVTLDTRVELAGDARFIGWEINCLGRPVLAERFDHGQALMRFQLYRDGQPVLLERFLVQGETALDAPAGLRGRPVFASLYATPADTACVVAVREHLAGAGDGQLGITLVDGVLVARYLGESTEQARKLFIRIWEALRPLLLGRPACPPRIWNT
jgi:urease accessory protein